MKRETICIHGGYEAKNGEPLTLPIARSTTYKYDSSDHIGKLFDLSVEGHMYSRISNPTLEAVEKKIAALENGVGALCTSSGQAANMLAVLNIAKAGDHILSMTKVYGGTENLFDVTLRRLGLDFTFADPDLPDEELQKLIKPNTKAVFGETLANPALAVFDIERLAAFAHRNGVPLIVDNTFPTAVLCRPFDFGADIVTYSTTKYMEGHALTMGGCIVDSGNFDWDNGKFTCLTQPEPSYHGLVYTQAFGKAAYISRARTQLMRDMGVCQTADNAFLLDIGLQTLALRMEKHCSNALTVARFLNSRDNVESVNYPALKSDPYYPLAKKYLPNGCAGVVSFTVSGGRQAAVKVIDGLRLFTNAVHVATVQSLALHPASSTHRQLSDEMLKKAGVNPGLIRLSVGIEDIDDILQDLENALK